jgi:thiosulfate/3-mercaptopyruvate sulfurtransferase
MRYQFVDCRYDLAHPELGRERYLAGHIPGASFLDLRADLSDLSAAPEAGRHPLPTPDAFAESAARAGVGDGVFVVAYDEDLTGGAARLWWLLLHFGHDDVAVLDGGLRAWAGPLRSGPEEAEPARFEPRPRGDDTIGADELARKLGEPGMVVVDARSPERFRGDVEPFDPVGGHVPGARNWPHAQAGDVPSDLLEAPELVVYCGSGVTACVDLLALARAGRPDARLFPGSWSEWSRRGLAVERGG